MYKWIDSEGREHYSNIPPENSQENVEKIKPKSGVSVMGTGNTNAEPEKKSHPILRFFQKEEPRADHEVDLYVTSWCGYCKKAKKFFDSRDIAYNEYDIEKDPAAAGRKRDLSGGKGVPFAVVNGHKIRGYSPSAYERALKSR